MCVFCSTMPRKKGGDPTMQLSPIMEETRSRSMPSRQRILSELKRPSKYHEDTMDITYKKNETVQRRHPTSTIKNIQLISHRPAFIAPTPKPQSFTARVTSSIMSKLPLGSKSEHPVTRGMMENPPDISIMKTKAGGKKRKSKRKSNRKN